MRRECMQASLVAAESGDGSAARTARVRDPGCRRADAAGRRRAGRDGAGAEGGYIYNFVKFTEWPPVQPVSDPFVICVIGDAAVGDALARVIEGRQFEGRRMVVVLGPTPRPAGTCRVLYLSGATLGEAVICAVAPRWPSLASLSRRA